MITSSFVVCYLLNLIGLDSVPSCIGSSGNNIDGPVLNVYYGHSFISQETWFMSCWSFISTLTDLGWNVSICNRDCCTEKLKTLSNNSISLMS